MYSTRKHRRKLGICPNCNHILQSEDNYCPSCGQENHDLKVPVGHLVYEFIESIFHFDIKVWETLKAIVIRPGKVIADFNEGKRARYVPPARLYIFISVIFFFLAGKEVNESIKKGEKQFFQVEAKIKKMDWKDASAFEDLPDMIIGKKLPEDVSARIAQLSSGEKTVFLNDFFLKASEDSIKKYYDNFSKLDTNKIRQELAANLSAIKDEYPGLLKKDSLSNGNLIELDNDIFLDSVTLVKVYSDPVVMDSLFKANKIEGRFRKMGTAGSVRLNMFLLFDQKEKLAFIQSTIQKALKYISFMMFILMPVVALILALFYIRKKKFYYEHFIFSVMTHSVIFMIFSTSIMLGWWIDSEWVQATAILLSLFYILASLKYVYKNGWVKTIFKFFIMFIIYSVLALLILGGVFGYSIIV